MENAVEALKMIFGVIIFSFALTVLFRMTSLARDTADQIFETIDSTTYQTVQETEKTSKSIQEIIPGLYRYVQEGYAVIVIDPSGNTINDTNIVAMFDSAIEGYVATCKWSATQYNGLSGQEKENSNNGKLKIEEYINKHILNSSIIKDYNITEIVKGATSANTEFSAHSELNTLMKRIYKNVKVGGNDNTQQPVYTDWQSGNRDRDSYITQRVNCDVYGGRTLFNSKYSGVGTITNSRETSGGHEAVCGEAGLLATYKNATFTEYIEIIDENDYEQESDLLKYGTIRRAKKRVIIYVKNQE